MNTTVAPLITYLRSAKSYGGLGGVWHKSIDGRKTLCRTMLHENAVETSTTTPPSHLTCLRCNRLTGEALKPGALTDNTNPYPHLNPRKGFQR